MLKQVPHRSDCSGCACSRARARDKCAHLLEENSEIARQLSEEKMQALKRGESEVGYRVFIVGGHAKFGGSLWPLVSQDHVIPDLSGCVWF